MNTLVQNQKCCKVCSKRLDRVSKYTRVHDKELIEKLNYLKSCISAGDFVCNKCALEARKKAKNRSKSFEYDEFAFSNENYEELKNEIDSSIIYSILSFFLQ